MNDMIEAKITAELILFEKKPSIDLVYDNIYIGNYAAALDRSLLEQLGIKCILVSGKSLEAMFPSDFKYLIIPIYDSEYTKIEKYFAQTNLFIKEGSIDGKVLVHCGHGVSRSVSLVIAYLIGEKGIPYSKALKEVKEKRSVAKPNSGFDSQLRNYSYNLLKEF